MKKRTSFDKNSLLPRFFTLFRGVIVANVFEFNRQVTFDLESARQMLQLVYRITSEVDQQFQDLSSRITMAQSAANQELVLELEGQVQSLIQRWEGKMIKLGLEPKGLWLVDFNTGSGFYCWKYPELDIKFWHAYKDGFTGRKPIDADL